MVESKRTAEAEVLSALIVLIGGILSAIFIVLPLGEVFYPLILKGIIEIFPPRDVLSQAQLEIYASFIKYIISMFAGIIEEPAKVIGLILIAFKYPDWLSSKKKGALLGGFAGLGFAFFENFWYYIFTEASPLTRTFLSAPMTIFTSSILGMGLVYIAVKDSKDGRITFLKLLLLTVVLHGLFNGLAIFGLAGGLTGLSIAGVALYLCYITLPTHPTLSKPAARLILPHREISIMQKERMFGRSDFENDVEREYQMQISRSHFKITREDGKFYIQDTSLSGTKLNGMEIKGRYELKNNDEITLPGNLKIKFKYITSLEGGDVEDMPTELSSIHFPKPITINLILPNRVIEITEPERIFGRDDFLQEDISDTKIKYISREHFRIINENNRHYIYDISTNGTKVNGVEVKGKGKQELKDGDDIILADVLKLRFRAG